MRHVWRVKMLFFWRKDSQWLVFDDVNRVVTFAVPDLLSILKEFHCLSHNLKKFLKIRSLGAFYFISEFKAALISLLNTETFFLLCSVCFSSLASAVQVHDTCVERQAGSLPSVFGRCLWGSWPACLPIHTRPLLSHQLWCLPLCPWQLEAVISPSFSAFIACGWEVSWIALCSSQ